MSEKINLNIRTDSRILENSKIIYTNDCIERIQLRSNEDILDYSQFYDHASLNVSKKEIFYILFSGKKIKQNITRKKTLITIKKIKLDILNDLTSLKHFKINQFSYKLQKVDNLFPCDLLYAEGGIFDANELHSAVFFPYFMENRDVEGKSTLIFVNIMFERLKLISKNLFLKLGFKLIIDGEEINLHNITKKDVARWITLHEYVHNSGPLPLFTSTANKFSTKKYGVIEEMRVDLTSIKIIIDYLFEIDKSYIKMIAIIIIERLFRGALYNFHPKWDNSKNEMFAKEVEGDASIALMIILNKYNFLDLEKRAITFTCKQMVKLAEDVLCDIYKYEKLANEKDAFSTTSSKFVTFFKEKYLQTSPIIMNFLNRHSVQNCRYNLSFTK